MKQSNDSLTDPLKAEFEPDPLHWRKPRISSELVTQGEAIARLAVELARLARTGTSSHPSDKSPQPLLVDKYLGEAWDMLQKACKLVPFTVNLSEIPSDEGEEHSQKAVAAMLERGVIPWAEICAEGKRAEEAPTRNVELLKDGKPFIYRWKAYVQIEKKGGLRALLARHGERMAFGSEEAVQRLEALRGTLAENFFKAKRRKTKLIRGVLSRNLLSKNSRWGEWTRTFMAEALRATSQKKGETPSTWANRVVEDWKRRCVEDFASRLLNGARESGLLEVDFNEIAVTRKLHPPGGSKRRTNDTTKGTNAKKSGD